MAWLSRFQPQLLALLRITAAYMYFWHGTAKFFGYPTAMGHVELLSLMGAAGVLEIGGGLLLMLGLFTRPVAFLLSGQMAVAYFMAHSQPSMWMPLLNKGEPAALFCFIFLYLAAAGGGAPSLDGLLRRKRA